MTIIPRVDLMFKPRGKALPANQSEKRKDQTFDSSKKKIFQKQEKKHTRAHKNRR